MRQLGREAQLLNRWTAAQPVVAAFIDSLVTDPHVAQDLLQEVATAVVSKYHQYDPERPFTPWVVAIARNKVFEHSRRARSRPLLFNTEVVDRLVDAYEKLDEQRPELDEAVRHCVGKLPARSRKLIELRYRADLKPIDIARQTGVEANAVSVALNRVRAALRTCIERRLIAGGGGI